MLFPPFLAWVWATFSGVLLLPFFPFQLDKRSPSSKSLKKNLSPPTRTEPIETSAHYNIIIDYFSLCSFSVCIVPSFHFFIQLLKGKNYAQASRDAPLWGERLFLIIVKVFIESSSTWWVGCKWNGGAAGLWPDPRRHKLWPQLDTARSNWKGKETRDFVPDGNWQLVEHS